jgi:hypothetical protein
MDFEPVGAEVALAAERVDGRRVVVAHALLLGVVAHALADVGIAAAAPDVEGQLEAGDEDALAQLASRSPSACTPRKAFRVDVSFGSKAGG